MVFMIAELNPFVPSCINLVLSTHLCMFRIIKVAAVEILTQSLFFITFPLPEMASKNGAVVLSYLKNIYVWNLFFILKKLPFQIAFKTFFRKYQWCLLLIIAPPQWDASFTAPFSYWQIYIWFFSWLLSFWVTFGAPSK